MTAQQTSMMMVLLFVKLVIHSVKLVPIHQHVPHAIPKTTEILLMDNVSAHLDTIKSLMLIIQLLVKNVVLNAKNAVDQLFVWTAKLQKTESLVMMKMDIKLVTALQDTVQAKTDLVFKMDVLLIHIVKFVMMQEELPFVFNV